mmetsp:Transcript_23207/g.59213  ORF Transcript_23207/g.59213 Transcript_23207/m.59213 type:complete len:247 (+) Transcript_23207:849-1589(+)
MQTRHRQTSRTLHPGLGQADSWQLPESDACCRSGRHLSFAGADTRWHAFAEGARDLDTRKSRRWPPREPDRGSLGGGHFRAHGLGEAWHACRGCDPPANDLFRSNPGWCSACGPGSAAWRPEGGGDGRACRSHRRPRRQPGSGRGRRRRAGRCPGRPDRFNRTEGGRLAAARRLGAGAQRHPGVVWRIRCGAGLAELGSGGFASAAGGCRWRPRRTLCRPRRQPQADRGGRRPRCRGRAHEERPPE